ncbi:MAG: 4'-phosphopantetheinyl transferase superfamily protein [Deltaproteobacteria bacterium]|jgi:4'-phosphopantetheinyl transferase EntD|nr:4'-phosphopantetheinyl transferase superfamily protein [Deltaproteobacteria bacterium]
MKIGPSPHYPFINIFPDFVALEQCSESFYWPLLPSEHEYIKQATPERVLEFSMGRHCARQALAHFGVNKSIPLIARDNLPVWPEGFTGSISHTSELCVAAVCRTTDALGLGVDIENVEDWDVDIDALLMTENEKVFVGALGCRYSALIFSAKECFFKAYYPLTKVFLDMTDIEVEIDPLNNCFFCTLTNSYSPPFLGKRSFWGSYQQDERFVYTGVVLAQEI